jgi:WD40 repeat protein
VESNGKLSVWDAQSWRLVLVLPEEQHTVYCLAWSPGGEQLAAGTADGGLVVWNLPRVRAQLAAIGLGW